MSDRFFRRWTWEDEKSLGVEHLDRMAELHRGFESNWRGHAESMTENADRAAARAEQFERAAAEVRIESIASTLEPPLVSRILCGIATGRGFPCSRVVDAEGDRCWQHR